MIREIDWYNSNFIKDRNIKFRLKDIFSDHWDNFVNAYSNIDIRPIVHKEVKKMISCHTSELGYSVYKYPNCDEIKISYHTCKSRFCPPMETNMLENVLKLFFKNAITVNIDILYSLFLIVFGHILEKIVNF